jgi:hypothetical protein
MADRVESVVGRLVERVGSSYFGKYRGLVTDIEDPQNACRIRATVPAVLGEHPCGWAMPAAPFAGPAYGVVMLPAIGSGVWIEFEAGRLDSPIWSGAWWASGQRPEPQGPKLRVIVSENGHTVILDDHSDEVRVIHGSGPEIKMTGSDIVLTVGACELRITSTEISLNNGMVKVGQAGVSLAGGALSAGTPP